MRNGGLKGVVENIDETLNRVKYYDDYPSKDVLIELLEDTKKEITPHVELPEDPQQELPYMTG
jgi:hypothetical protein